MAPEKRGCGHENKGPEPQANKQPSKTKGRRGCKPAEQFIAEAVTSYKDKIDEGIQKLIDDGED